MSSNQTGVLRCPRCGNQALINESEQNNAEIEVIKRRCPSCFTGFYLVEDILMYLNRLNAALVEARVTNAKAPPAPPAK